MYKNKTFLAIIPARGGSKRLPRKNVLKLAGKPLIAWSIEAGLQSQYIDKVIVTSDDDEILNISSKYMVDTLKREATLASDTATTVDVLLDVINQRKHKYDYIVLLQPTSPLRDEKLVDRAIELLDEKNADAIVSVCEMEHSPLWSNTLQSNGNMSAFIKEEVKNKRSQELDKFFRINGAIYICNLECFLREKTLFLKNNIFSFIMDRKKSIDIDEEIDFKLASLIMDEYTKC